LLCTLVSPNEALSGKKERRQCEKGEDNYRRKKGNSGEKRCAGSFKIEGRLRGEAFSKTTQEITGDKGEEMRNGVSGDASLLLSFANGLKHFEM
jgi:hypothetical protein